MSRKTVARICYILGWVIIILMLVSGVIGFLGACIVGSKTGAGGRGFLIGFLFLIYAALIGVMSSLGFFALSGVVEALDDQLIAQQGMYRAIMDIKNNMNSGVAIDSSKTTPAPVNEQPAAPSINETSSNNIAAETPSPQPVETPKAETTEAPIPEQAEAPKAETTEAPMPEPVEAPKVETTEAPIPEQTETPKVEQPEAPKAETVETPNAETPETPKAESTITSAADVIEPFKEDSIEALMNTPNEASEMDTTILTSELKAPDYIPNETYEIDKSWVCSMCGRENSMGSFCIACGSKKIEKL